MWTSSDTNTKIIAAAGTGQRNELRFFESAEEKDAAGYKSTHFINEFKGGIYSMDFS
jgi:hypothetical protein